MQKGYVLTKSITNPEWCYKMANSYRLKPKVKNKIKKEVKEFPELEPVIPDEEIYTDELIYDPSLIEEDDLPME